MVAKTSELLFRWSLSGGNVSIIKKAFRALAHIRSFGDLARYVIMAAVLAKLKVVRLFSK